VNENGGCFILKSQNPRESTVFLRESVLQKRLASGIDKRYQMWLFNIGKNQAES